MLLVDDDAAISGLTMRAAGAARATDAGHRPVRHGGRSAPARGGDQLIALDYTHTARAAELHEPATAVTATEEIRELLADAQRAADGDLYRDLEIDG